ncbi:MAG: LD-carboxypeptidase [Saprospiraceae bacterium]|nr:LD-carboxypeptidase [Saprospiraceae bacterium]
MDRRSFGKLVVLTPAMGSILLEESNASSCISQKMIKPPALKKGDKVGLIAPGSPIQPEKFQNAVTNLENLGLVPVYTETVFKRNGYLAGTDQERLDDLHKMIADTDVKAVWCLRGGYGCTRLLPMLDYKLIRKNPKIIIGYSDVTALLLAIHQKTGLITFHGPVAISNIFTPYSAITVESVLFGNTTIPLKIPYTEQSDQKFQQDIYTITKGVASGILTGGNLSLLVALIGTKYAPTYKNKIVFIEDVGEKPYRIDRMLTQMIQATDISKAAGIILGVFHDCEAKESDLSFTLKKTISEKLSQLNIPCFYGFSFGHVSDICTFPIGTGATMDAQKFTIELEQQSVKV